jgi:hypothetical protein
MKKIVVVILCLSLFPLFIQSQSKDRNNYKNFEVMKVQLKEKFNLPARNLPKLLVKAYCEGLIQGYYPLNVDSVCSYYSFVKHFGFGKIQPIPSADEYTDINCPFSFCYDPNNPYFEPFMQNYEIIQTKRFDANKSSEVYDIRYIRLIFVKEKGGQEFDLLGPVFKYDDVIALTRDDFKIMNPKNDAAGFTFKQYFEKRMFQGYTVKPSLNQSTTPNQKDKREKDSWNK